MKFIHLSDLHLGKRVNEFSMIEDQEYILKKIIDIIDEERPDGIFIAGDVYDKSVPSAEAVQLFDDFLCRLAERNLQVFVISGNHDSSERIAFGSKLMNQSGVHMSPVYNGNIEPTVLTDELGEVAIYMLPFIKPAHIRQHFPEKKIESYTDALRTAVEQMDVNKDRRNILLTHQFVTGALRSDSEEISVGGTDNVDASVFDDFEYVALGHIHRPQHILRETVRYSGTPLKYSFSEAKHKKSVTIINLNGDGEITIDTTELVPKHDLREIKGTYMELTAKSFYEGTDCDDYLHITLTDEEDIPDVVGKLRVIYPNLMKLDYDNARTRGNMQIEGAEDVEDKTPLDLFAEFYQQRNNQPMNSEQSLFMENLIEKIWEDEA